jgi:hypothetical protein
VLLSVVTLLFMLMGCSVLAMSKRDCGAAWAIADTNKDGFLTLEESARYFAAIGVGDRSIANGELSQTDFMAHCQAGLFDARQSDAAAPNEGANSFTEKQAKDRVLAHGYRNVSPLQQDADGIWRGTAELNGIKVNVAVDYRGNVVSKYP